MPAASLYIEFDGVGYVWSAVILNEEELIFCSNPLSLPPSMPVNIENVAELLDAATS
jgi:hypothetical protein